MQLSSKGRKEKIIQEIEQIELFTSLDDMWLFNWDELNRTNDLKWLIKNEKDREKYVPNNILDEKFIEMIDHWYKLTDANSNRKELYVLMKKAITARNDVMKGDKFQMNWVNRYEKMIKDISGDNSTYDPNKQRAQLSVALKMFINKHTITVVDYFSFMEVALEMNTSNTEDNG